MSPTDSPAAHGGADALLQQAYGAHQRGDLDAAERLYGAALALKPNELWALANLGVVHLQKGRPAEALPWLDRALSLHPDQASVLANRGGALHALGRPQEALDSVRRAVALDPDQSDALNTEGLLLLDLGQPAEALAVLDKALGLKPGQPYYLNNRGVALSALSRPQEALACFERALAGAPRYVEALSNRAAALRASGRPEEALAACEQVLAVRPNYPDAWVNRGCALRDLGRPDEALNAFAQACALNPAHVEAHWSLALQLLAAGRWAEGWPLFEWRWRRPDFQPLAGRFEGAPWLGQEDIAGKTLLLHYEQGLGDSMQMLRYAAPLAERGARIVLAVQRALLPMVEGLRGVVQTIAEGDPLPAYDLHCPLMSLPLALHPSAGAPTWRGPYLSAPSEAEARWREWLKPLARPRIGLVWSGNPRHMNDRNRSLSLEALQSLLQAEADFISLQKVYREGDRERLKALGVIDASDALSDFGDTAGLVAGLDAVISVDTSVAHLAGAMGKPLLLLLPFTSDPRWGLVGDHSDWYPTARLLRQAARGDWSAPMAQARAAIEALRADQPG